MKLKLICCEVFYRLACIAAAASPNTTDMEFTALGAHESPDTLREQLQEKIDRADSEKSYDAILLGYGLCGNSTSGLAARTKPLVIPRAHDCCTIYLGGTDKYLEHFKDNPSSEWSSCGYMERNSGYLRETDTGKLLGFDRDYDELVSQYGEENALYIWETLHPADHTGNLTYIEIPEMSGLGFREKFGDFAAEKGRNVRIIKGDMRLIRGLLNGDWDNDEYLVVPPGREITALYDFDRIFDTRK